MFFNKKKNENKIKLKQEKNKLNQIRKKFNNKGCRINTCYSFENKK